MANNWNMLVVSFSNLASDEKLSLKMVKNSMLNEQAKNRKKGDAPSSGVYVAESHDKNDIMDEPKRDFSKANISIILCDIS
jgi:hypothetical protein